VDFFFFEIGRKLFLPPSALASEKLIVQPSPYFSSCIQARVSFLCFCRNELFFSFLLNISLAPFPSGAPIPFFLRKGRVSDSPLSFLRPALNQDFFF